jgi:hypothetical protein
MDNQTAATIRALSEALAISVEEIEELRAAISALLRYHKAYVEYVDYCARMEKYGEITDGTYDALWDAMGDARAALPDWLREKVDA